MMFNGQIPENIIIHSPELIDQALEYMEIPKDVRNQSDIKIHGIRVVRDFAEITGE